MKQLNAQEIKYVSGGLTYEVYEAIFPYAGRMSIGGGIVSGLICSSTSPATTFTGSLYAFGYYSVIGAAGVFVLLSGELISNMLFEEYSPMLEAKINSYFGIQRIT